MNETEMAQAKAQAVVGSVLVFSPAWVQAINTISLVASCIAAVGGAILAVHGVYKIVRGKR